MVNLLLIIITICVIIWTVYLIMLSKLTIKHTKMYKKIIKDLALSFDEIIRENKE